jgi:AcrR family transcriptional regulator
MSAITPPLIHEALVYSSAEEFLARLLPFVEDGLAAGQPVIAVLEPGKIALLSDALGDQAEDVLFGDAGHLYRRPAHAVAEYRQHLDAQLSARPDLDLVRVIGEVRFGSSTEEHDGWRRYESMLNESFADYPAWIICPYDARALPERVVADAHCTHRFISTGDRRDESSVYIETDEVVARAVLRESGDVDKEPIAGLTIRDESELEQLRRFVGGSARAAGLAPPAVLDVVVAAGELARDALRHGEASVHVFRNGARWMCDVTGNDSGRTARGAKVGLSIARVVSDRVELSSAADTHTVRLNLSSTAKARQRVLDAASELFYQRGIRASGTNAIIAHAGVSKATFFRHFPSKNDLVVAWLEQPARRWFDRIQADLESTTEPKEKLLAFFDLLGGWFAEDDFRGCPFQNAAAETPEADHPVRQAAHGHVREIEHFFRQTAAAARLAHPDRIAQELTTLALGAIATAVAVGSPAGAKIAGAAAERLLTQTD